MLILDHGDDYFTVSGHLAELRVAVGDAVAAGEPVGAVGDTGSLQGPRLYFEIRRGAEPLDPAEWLGALDAAPKGS
jgi:septal ring factor EnvC (AmiA/AmiB activator)